MDIPRPFFIAIGRFKVLPGPAFTCRWDAERRSVSWSMVEVDVLVQVEFRSLALALLSLRGIHRANTAIWDVKSLPRTSRTLMLLVAGDDLVRTAHPILPQYPLLMTFVARASPDRSNRSPVAVAVAMTRRKGIEQSCSSPAET